MRIVKNEKLASRNRRITTYLFLATMVILIGGFVLVNYSLFTGEVPAPELVFLQALSLPVAFILTLVSVRMTNTWARRPYPDEAIQEGLKGLSKKSIIYHYYHFPARHVLIAPQGIFAIITRWHGDRFTYNGKRWITHKSAISRFFSAIRMDGVGDPIGDATRAAEHLAAILKPIAGDVEVQPVIVFLDPRAEVEVTEESPVPIVFADDKREPNLTNLLRDLNRSQKSGNQQRVILPLTDEQIEQFERVTIK
jgi:hypothetical protein